MAKTVFIDLTKNKINIQESNKETVVKFLGSRGYAAKLLYDLVPAEADPLGAENCLIFSTGPLTGTPWPTSARYTVTAKSPLTGIYGYANSSGFFGPEMRKAGYDAFVFSGKADKPRILVVQDDTIELIDGSQYWGKDTEETEKLLKKRYTDCRVASIGPAGERLVKISSVINDFGRAAARCGMGAVMGSKNLKAVVVQSSGEVPYTGEFKKIALEMMRKCGKHPGSEFLRRWGTAELVDPKNLKGDLPSRNHQRVQFKRADKVNAESLNGYLEKNDGCYSCPIRCSRFTQVKSGPYACKTEGPEYETINSLGPLLDNDNLESIIYGNLLCNRYGIDTISAGMVIAFAMECYENGLLPDQSAKIDLSWGNIDTILKLLQMIAYREGLGDLLAEGVRNAALKIGGDAGKYALHVKGLEIPMQEPRTCKGMALGHATSNRGADHLYALPTIDLTGNSEIGSKYFPECMPELLEPNNETYKPEMNVFTEAFCAVSDALGICKFSTAENFALEPEDVARGLSEMPGYTLDGSELIKAGERIVNIERMFNHRLGLTRQDDQLPGRFLNEPVSVYDTETWQPIKEGLTVDLDFMLDKYYKLRNWTDTGTPREEKLRELGLEELISDL